MRRNRGERDLVGFLEETPGLDLDRLLFEIVGFFWGAACSGAAECSWGLAVADAGCAGDADCARARTTGRRNAHNIPRNRILRKCPATFFNYRRKLLPRRETSSSARLRISSCEK